MLSKSSRKNLASHGKENNNNETPFFMNDMGW
jgi:hypothetical protein